jgi:hypothetical protein
MAYDANSTHPIGSAIVRSSGNVPAEDLAEQIEWVYSTDDASDVQSLSLPNTFEIRVRDGDGSVAVFIYDANEAGAHDGVNVVADNDERKFVVRERVLTQSAYDALTPKATVRYYITAEA